MEKVKLNELFTIRKGKKAQESSEGKFNYITIENLHSKTYSQKTDDIGVQVDFKDILIAWDGANAGLVGTKFTGVIGSTLAQLKLKDQYLNNVDTYYIFRYLDSKFEFIKSKRTGATIPHVNGDELRGMHIPLPDLATQKAIAAKLDKADEIRQLNKKLIEQYDALTQSLFFDMFGDPVKNEKGWEFNSLSDITTKIGSGSTPRGGKESYKTEGISLIRSMNIYDNRFFYKDLAFIDENQAAKLSNVDVKEGDILFNITGASVCRCTIVPKDVLPARVNQHVSIIRVNEDVANTIFINYQLVFESTKRQLLKIGSGGGAVMEAITKEQLQKFHVINPPITLQNQFAERVKAIEAQKALAQQALQQSEDLFNSLLQESFQ